MTIDERNQVSAITSYLANGTGGKGEFANVSIVANGTTYKLAPDFHCGRGIAEGA
ncbi:MAG: hypothetical protein QHC67_02960 [Sphingobium sp.]|uniref:hypothetical protein n=1 Tax=Sphingobium sp. TaxID=1912891 RepID=UPI0029AD1F57|nr:hypothetical protein [Sphingobium sp.]MDX3908758.1 hypothetical protein [Sphingobium sp.]